MKIAFFIHEKSLGGASKALLTLTKQLLKKGYKIYIVVPIKNSDACRAFNGMNVEIISNFYSWWQLPVNASLLIRYLYKFLYRFCNPLSIYLLTNKIKKLDIDLIHSNSSTIDIGAHIANKLKIKHIWHFREHQENNLCFIKNRKNSLSFIESHADHIIYVSKDIYQVYNRLIPNVPQSVIYDGISNEYCIKKSFDTKKEVTTFLVAGTLQETKGQHLAIEAIHLLVKQGYHNFHLLIAGGDPVHFKATLELKVKEYQLDKYVTFLGYCNDIVKVRKGSDVELLCSYREAFGLSTVEAMMCSNPVIGSNSGGTPELISDGVNGFLFESNNFMDLANKMVKFLEHHELLAKLGQGAYLFSVSKFNETMHVENIESIYKKF